METMAELEAAQRRSWLVTRGPNTEDRRQKTEDGRETMEDGPGVRDQGTEEYRILRLRSGQVLNKEPQK